MTGGNLFVLLARVAGPVTPEERDAAWNEIAAAFAATNAQRDQLAYAVERALAELNQRITLHPDWDWAAGIRDRLKDALGEEVA